jgi:hypothetical protein
MRRVDAILPWSELLLDSVNDESSKSKLKITCQTFTRILLD